MELPGGTGEIGSHSEQVFDEFVTYFRGIHIRALAVVGDNLYAGGLFKRAGGKQALWHCSVGWGRVVAAGLWIARRRRDVRRRFDRTRWLVREQSPRPLR